MTGLGFVPDDDVSKVDPVDLPAVNYSSLALESTANYEPLIVETTNCEVEKTTKIAPTEEGGGDGAEPDDDDVCLIKVWIIYSYLSECEWR